MVFKYMPRFRSSQPSSRRDSRLQRPIVALSMLLLSLRTGVCALPIPQTERSGHNADLGRSPHGPITMSLTAPPRQRGGGFFVGMIPKTSTMIATTSSYTANKPPRALWYRDRSSAEEQLTLPQNHDAPALMTSTVGGDYQHHSDQVATASLPTGQNAQADLSLSGIHTSMIGDINLPLVLTTCLSHAAALAIAGVVVTLSLLLVLASSSTELFHLPFLDIWSLLDWNSNNGGIQLDMARDHGTPLFHSLLDWTITPKRLVEGMLGAIPLVTMATFCMENPATCHVRFSISKAVLELFGRRRRRGGRDELDAMGDSTRSSTATNTFQVMFFTLIIATASAISEEIIFRGLLPAAVVSCTHSVGLALLGQAMVFGLGQIRATSPIAENGIFSIMQSINGVWYGAIYLASGGDILAVIIAHALYECHILVGAWKAINDQLDYTEDACRLSVAGAAAAEALSQRTLSLDPETLDFGRRYFYSFDHEHQGSLSLGNVKQAVAYAFQQDASLSEPPNDFRTTAVFHQLIQQRQPETFSVEDRLSLSEFLNLLYILTSKA